MTDTTTEAPATEAPEAGWGEAPAVTYPEYGPLPEARISLNFTPGKAPQLTVRAHTAAELTAALQELEEGNVYNVIGLAHSSLGAQVAIGAGLGPASQVPAPQGPPAPPVMGTGPAFNPPPAMPGVTGQAPAAWQNAGAPAAPPQGQWGNQAPQGPSPEYAQAGWYRLTVPFPKKGEFDGLCTQYQMRKGRPSEGGSFSFQKADKSWYVSPQFAGGFGQFNPVPA